jgi:iron complex outermembrane receptor protein
MFTKKTRRSLCAVLVMLASAGQTAVRAQNQNSAIDIALLPIEDLMNIEITSASHKEQRFGDIPAAVYVITEEDIRRSGLTTVPELLRLVPGMQVAQINSNKWAVAVRGFNNLFGGKLLVLVDGRSMYDRLNSAVFWESLDIPLDLIERIEVIRGSGGATWGANAVNGVINIVTKTAGETRGAAATVRAGTFDGTQASARYGGMMGGVAYRVYSKWSAAGQSRLDANTGANDTWESQTHGLRLDWTRGADTLMAQTGVTLATLRGLWPPPSGPVPTPQEPFDESFNTSEYFGIGRWTRRHDDGSSLEVQSFFNFRHNADGLNPRQLMTDVDARYHARIRNGHDLVVGGGYRILDEETDGAFAFSISPKTLNEQVVNAFAQDEIALGRRVRLTLGAKIERDTYAGWGLQPTARAMWSVVPRRHHVWGAVSRALRTPSLGDVSGRYNYASFIGQGGLPVVVGSLGNPAYKSEEVVNGEGGYRLELGAAASVDVTAFVTSYDNLKTNEPLPPRMEAEPGPPHLFIPVGFGNLLEATTRGVEIAARWTPVHWWRLEGGYSTFHLTPHLSVESRDDLAASYDGNAPGVQWQARSAVSVTPRVQLDALLFHAGALRGLGVPAYTRADMRAEVGLTRQLSASLVGQNLLDPRHAEYAGEGAIVRATQIPRSLIVQLLWHF